MLIPIMGKNKDWPITVRLEEEEYRYVSKLAQADDRSLSVVARYLLKWGIDQHKKGGKLVYRREGDDQSPKIQAVSDDGKKEKKRA